MDGTVAIDRHGGGSGVRRLLETFSTSSISTHSCIWFMATNVTLADDHDHDRTPLPRSVELAEEHILPRAERELAVLHGNRLGRPYDGALDVGGRVVVDAIVQPTLALDDDLPERASGNRCRCSGRRSR